MSIDYRFDPNTGVMTVDDQPLVFHCNHYNRFLQYSIQHAVYAPTKDILVRSAAQVAFQTLKQHQAQHPELSKEELLKYASEVYSSGGYGLLDLQGALNLSTGDEVQINIQSSHFGSALCLNFEPPIEASEFFDMGYAIGALSAIHDQPFSGDLSSSAISLGDANTVLTLRMGEGEYDSIFSDTPNPLDPEQFRGVATTVPEKSFAPHIDENLIVSELAKVPLIGAPETGQIDAFGVRLTRMYADFYNLISFRFEKHLCQRMEELPELEELLKFNYPTLLYYEQYFNLKGLQLIQAMLIEAGHVCGFNTMGGIMSSDAWKQLVMPMFKTRDDWIQGIVSCINALGWGVWRIAELVPNEKLVLRAYHPYESLGYLRWFGKSDHGVDYCMSGVACSLMNLMYEGDITSYPELTPDYYLKVNRSQHSFWASQTQCVASGDEYSEIVVTRQARH